ncbi:MAG: M15 family metallopeptidase [Candidatus Nanopelagicales bacterium]
MHATAHPRASGPTFRALGASTLLLFALSACATGTATAPATPAPVSATGMSPSSSASTSASSSASAFDLVRLSDVDPTILQEIRYATDHNFLGRPVTGYNAAECWLTPQAAQALARAQREAVALGYTLKVYDCYRPQRAVSEFVAWAADPSDTTAQAEFYPRVAKESIIPDGYVAEKSGHSRGSTLDVTLVPLPGATSPAWTPEMGLVDCTAPVAQRFADTTVDMGTGFDCFDPLAHTADTTLTAEQRSNRDRLVTLMAAQGFRNLPEEWWHYTLAGEPHLEDYFDIPITAAGPNG